MPFTIAAQPDFADPSQRPGAGFDMVSSNYFKTYGIPILHGRAFSEQDTAASVHVAMVNQKFADKYFAGKDPLQQRINVEELIPGVTKLGPYITWQVVGVFNNVRAGGFRDDFPVIVIPFAQNPQIALAEPHTLEELKSRNLGGDRFIMTLMGGFASIALLLAAVGIYGVMAFTVAQREHEIGLRMALGASRGNVVKLILKEALILSGIGLAIGLIGAFFIGRALHSVVYGVGTVDYGAIICVSMILAGASMLASWLPARRAASIEPMQALRTE